MIKKSRRPWNAIQPAGDNFRDEIAINYVADRINHPLWNKEHNALDLLLSKIHDCVTVLDVPFGTGRFVPIYQMNNMEISGVDISPDMLAEAKKILGNEFDTINVKVASADSLPFEDNSFDLLVCVRFLESIIPMSMVPSCLREFRRVCKRYAVLKFNNRLTTLPSVSAPKGDERMGAKYFFKEVLELAFNNGFELVDNIIIDENESSQKRMCLFKVV